MNKRLWGSVVGVLGLLATASIVAAPAENTRRLATFGRAAAARVTSAMGDLAWVETALGRLSWPVTAAIGGTALILALALVAWRRRAAAGAGEPWRTVIQMGRQGRNAIEIARATGLPQDAVRIVLAPVAVDRAVPDGKTFRSTPPGAGSSRPGRRRGGYA